MANRADLKHADNESIVESLKDLAGDLGVLLRQDLEEARAEMVEKVKAAGAGAGLFTGSVLTAFLTLFSLTVLLMVVLSLWMKPWLAVLIVTLVWGAVTAILAMGGKKKFAEAGPPIPEHAIANVKADIAAAKAEVRSAK
ncbi:MAG: phage holin family protein [Candidatus Eremiobacteraeota bacterium]|nr:phage holin family protein [Candidatus Eremiobacteraeota bacterium]